MSAEHGWEREPAEVPACPGCGGEGHHTPALLKAYNLARYECLTCRTYYVGTQSEWDKPGNVASRKRWKAAAE